MTDAARIAALEAALADVQARLDPQRLAQSMEFVWQPRGGEPRIIDENGVTLDYVPAIQFLGATTELDVPAQRAVVTTAGGGAANYTFSDDATPTASQRIDFVGAAAPGETRATLSTSTTGTARATTLGTAEDFVAAAGPFALLTENADPGTDTGDVTATVYDAAFARTASGGPKLVSTDTAQFIGVAAAVGGSGSVFVTADSVSASAELSAAAATGLPAETRIEAASDDVARVEVTSSGDTLAQLELRVDDATTGGVGVLLEAGSSSATVSAQTTGGTVVLLDAAGNTDFPRVRAPGSGSIVTRTLTGPLTAASGMLASGASSTVALSAAAGNLNTGTAALLGGLLSSAGAPGDTEHVAWSWKETGVGTIDIYFTNTDLVGAHEATLVAYCAEAD